MSNSTIPLPSQTPRFLRAAAKKAAVNLLKDAFAESFTEIMDDPCLGYEAHQLYKAMADEIGHPIAPCPNCESDYNVKLAGSTPEGDVFSCDECGRNFTRDEAAQEDGEASEIGSAGVKTRSYVTYGRPVGSRR